MGLKIFFKDTDENFIEVTDTTPIATSHADQLGDSKVIKIFIKNDDNTKWYSDIIAKPIDLNASSGLSDVIFVDTGWGIKLSPALIEPSLSEWEPIIWGEEIKITDIGNDTAADTSTYFPFWYLITCPPGERVKNKSNIVLNIAYTENAVTI